VRAGGSHKLTFPTLAPLPYHTAIVRFLEKEEPDVWRWARSAESQKDYADTIRRDLLKETYRLDAEGHPELHAHCRVAAERLGVTVPITLYQAGNADMNAGLLYLPGEAHVVLYGQVLDRLKGEELQALLGHELAHHVLWSLDGGIYHAADRVLTATVNDVRAGHAHRLTAHRMQLFTEVFADRGGAVACGALDAAVQCLVKMQTGVSSVSAASYLKQVHEVLGEGEISPAARSHPDAFVRARALELWCAADPQADAWLANALYGPLSVESLDILGQAELTALTRRVLGEVLRPRCMRSDTLLSHARQYFPDIQAADVVDEALPGVIREATGTHEYFAAVLMDFVAADRELEDIPFAAALLAARRLGLEETFEKFSTKHLTLPKRRLTTLKRDAEALLAKSEAQHG
jgi:hypothetical protein